MTNSLTIVMRALIDDRMDPTSGRQDTEPEEYPAALPTPIHLIVDMAELEDANTANEEAARHDQRQLLHHEVQATPADDALALDASEA